MQKLGWATLVVVAFLGTAFIALELTSPERRQAREEEKYDACMDELEPQRIEVQELEKKVQQRMVAVSGPLAWRDEELLRLGTEREQKKEQLAAAERKCELIKTATP